MESHYRFHNGAMLLLEAALKDRPDEIVSKALEQGAHFISNCTDNTDLGLWFLHDSLEESADMMKAAVQSKPVQPGYRPALSESHQPTNLF